MDLEDIDDEHAWITSPFDPKNALHRSLSEFERTLRCPICGELLHVPISIHPCQHSFCSECIRAHAKSGLMSMKREAKCPVCRESIQRDLKDLVPNRTVEIMVRQYKGLRTELMEALLNVDPQAHDRKRCRITPPESTAATEDTQVQTTTTNNSITTLRKRRPDTHYKGMHRNKLAELCRKYGLAETGDAVMLKARHQAFISLYNAECDSFTPRSEAEIAREINKRESAKKSEGRHNMMIGGHGQSMHMEQLKRSREAAGKTELNVDVSSGNQAFDAKLNYGFVAMTKELKERQKNEREQRPTTPIKMNLDSNPSSTIVDETYTISPVVNAARTNLHPHSTTPEVMRMMNPYTKEKGPLTVTSILPNTRSRSTVATTATTKSPIRCNTRVNPCMESSPNSIYCQSSSQCQEPAALSCPPGVSVMSFTTNPYDKNPTTASSTKALTTAKALSARRVKKCRINLQKDHVTASASLITANSLVEPAKARQDISLNTNNEKPVATTLIEANGSWTCYVCTFHNKRKAMTRSKCEMCSSVKGTLASGVTVSIDC